MTIHDAEIVTYYDHTASEYVDLYLHELERKPLDRYVLSSFANFVKGNGLTCDAGCGPGHIAEHLARLGVRVFGLDLSAGMVGEAKRCFPALDFYVANMLDLPVSDSCLAGIIAFYSIVHLGQSELPLLVKEFRRALQPAGYVLLAFHIGKQEVIRVNKKIREIEIAVDYIFHDYEYVVQCLAENGFALTEAFIRYPYRNVEYASRRAYILAQKV